MSAVGAAAAATTTTTTTPKMIISTALDSCVSKLLFGASQGREGELCHLF